MTEEKILKLIGEFTKLQDMWNLMPQSEGYLLYFDTYSYIAEMSETHNIFGKTIEETFRNAIKFMKERKCEICGK